MTESMFLYYEKLSQLDQFLFQTQGFWTTLFWIIAVLRIILNYSIYVMIDSGLYHPNIHSWKHAFVPQSTKEREELKKRYPEMKDPTIDGDSGGRDEEFLLICFFTFWWGADLGDTSKSIRRKRIANIINISFIPLLIGVIVLSVYLTEENVMLRGFEKDWFYFLK